MKPESFNMCISNFQVSLLVTYLEEIVIPFSHSQDLVMILDVSLQSYKNENGGKEKRKIARRKCGREGEE